MQCKLPQGGEKHIKTVMEPIKEIVHVPQKQQNAAAGL